ncbi:MAG: signal peptidase II [Deferribacteres bacterium]|nr:signal peptidase II [candidate division KSB1 bacterium]MCB9504037.1 signal peptidase II [Deferribacteres bacterium]
MRVLFITLGAVVLDQLTKLLVKSNFVLYESIKVGGDFFRLTYIENPGMAFGIRLAGPWFFTLFSTIASIVILIFLYRIRNERFLSRMSLALVLGGAIGNLIDRFMYGRVVDFLDFGWGAYRFWVFNVADICVSIGMTLLIFLVLFEKDASQQDNSRIPYRPKTIGDSEEHDIWHSN